MQRLAPTLVSLSVLGTFSLTASAASAADNSQCAALAAKVVGNAKVEVAEAVTSGSFKPDDGTALSGLPAFCHVRGLAKAAPKSNIHFELWMPIANWNGRIQMTGNGGYSPAMSFDQMAALLKSGSVAVATDTGHTGPGDDLSYGTTNDDAIADWGYRSVHESIVPAKALVTAFYGKAAQKTYFLGCSTGGHQGLVEAQKYPDDFDGILAGDPANNRTNLNLSFLWRFQTVHNQSDNSLILSPADLKRVNTAAMEQCDAADGVKDGIMSNPVACKFDVKKLQCAPGKTSDCLSDKQVEAMSKVYNTLKRKDNGEEIYTGWVVGSEWVEGTRSWDAYWADPKRADQPIRGEYLRGWIYHDANWNPWSFDWAKDVDFARQRVGAMADMNEVDLSAFKKRGGKIILYQGFVDPIVSALDTAKYYEKLQKANAGAADFTRLFMVPGMGHCNGGPGATSFSFAMNTDGDHDAVLAIQDWVEKGKAPEKIVATRFNKDRTVAMTRPLCSYPKAPMYSGKGDTNDASSFVCK